MKMKTILQYNKNVFKFIEKQNVILHYITFIYSELLVEYCIWLYIVLHSDSAFYHIF